ncbi:MAG: hypothetical protein IKD04_07100 [Clostridia bacterium]|nr:hypothetical protein [Clostridia bacterium]
MAKTKIRLMLFSIGAVGYGLIELMWRGYTHWSMLGAGGICFMSFARIGERMKNAGLVLKAAVGGTIVTAVELIFGIIFNIILKKNVWDYSKMPLNIGGQVCITYSFLWTLLSIVCIPLACGVSKKLTTRR